MSTEYFSSSPHRFVKQIKEDHVNGSTIAEPYGIGVNNTITKC